MICFLCHEDLPEKYYRICICQDSVLCEDCYYTMNENQQNIKEKCCICQRQLTIIRKRDMCKNIISFLPYSLYLLIESGYLMIVPFYIYKTTQETFPNSLFSSKEYFLYFSLLSTFILRGIVYLLIHILTRFNNTENAQREEYKKMKLFYDVVIFFLYTSQLIFSTVDIYIKKTYYFFIFFILVGIVTPLIAFQLAINFIYILMYYAKISKKNSKKIIKYEIFNNRNNLLGETEV